MEKATSVFNIGGGREISVNDLVQMILEIVASKSRVIKKPYRPGESPMTCVILDNKKAERKLGYRVSIPLQEGLYILVKHA
jgi:nucleoside-diphosphate-sugar epimerase